MEKIVFVVTPYSLSFATYPLTLAHWCGADLHVVSTSDDVPFAKVVLQRAAELKIPVFPSVIEPLSLNKVTRALKDLDGDLLVLGIGLARQISDDLPFFPRPVWVLNRTRASHQTVLSLLPFEKDATKQTQLALSVRMAAALNGRVLLAHLLPKERFLLGDANKVKHELISVTQGKLDRTTAELGDLLEDFGKEGVPMEHRVFHGDFRQKIAHQVEVAKVHCLVLSQVAQKTVKADWDYFVNEAPCSLLLLK